MGREKRPSFILKVTLTITNNFHSELQRWDFSVYKSPWKSSQVSSENTHFISKFKALVCVVSSTKLEGWLTEFLLKSLVRHKSPRAYPACLGPWPADSRWASSSPGLLAQSCRRFLGAAFCPSGREGPWISLMEIGVYFPVHPNWQETCSEITQILQKSESVRSRNTYQLWEWGLTPM